MAVPRRRAPRLLMNSQPLQPPSRDSTRDRLVSYHAGWINPQRPRQRRVVFRFLSHLILVFRAPTHTPLRRAPPLVPRAPTLARRRAISQAPRPAQFVSASGRSWPWPPPPSHATLLARDGATRRHPAHLNNRRHATNREYRQNRQPQLRFRQNRQPPLWRSPFVGASGGRPAATASQIPAESATTS